MNTIKCPQCGSEMVEGGTCPFCHFSASEAQEVEVSAGEAIEVVDADEAIPVDDEEEATTMLLPKQQRPQAAPPQLPQEPPTQQQPQQQFDWQPPADQAPAQQQPQQQFGWQPAGGQLQQGPQPMADAPKSKTGLIIGIIAGAVLLLGAIGAAAYFFLKPSEVETVAPDTSAESAESEAIDASASEASSDRLNLGSKLENAAGATAVTDSAPTGEIPDERLTEPGAPIEQAKPDAERQRQQQQARERQRRQQQQAEQQRRRQQQQAEQQRQQQQQQQNGGNRRNIEYERARQNSQRVF